MTNAQYTRIDASKRVGQFSLPTGLRIHRTFVIRTTYIVAVDEGSWKSYSAWPASCVMMHFKTADPRFDA